MSNLIAGICFWGEAVEGNGGQIGDGDMGVDLQAQEAPWRGERRVNHFHLGNSDCEAERED